jgi:hypothetical protein
MAWVCFIRVNTCKNVFPFVAPSNPPGTIILLHLILYHIRKIPWDFSYIHVRVNMCKKFFPRYGPNWPPGSWLLQTWFCTSLGSFSVLTFLSQGQKCSKIVSNIYIKTHVKKWISLLWPHPTPGDFDFNKLEYALC